MSKKVKLGKEILEQLKRIAELLPKIPTSSKSGMVQKNITGATAKAAGIKAAEGSGISKIEDHKMYAVTEEEFVCVNHFKTLKKIFAETGQKGVDDYVFKTKAKNLELIDEKVREAATPIDAEEIMKRKQKVLDDFEAKSRGKKRKPKLSGNKQTGKKSR